MNRKQIDWLYNNPYKLGHLLGYRDLNVTHNNWIRELWLSSQDETLMAHRNSFKTTSVLVVGIIWYLFFFPDSTQAIIRKSESGARSILIEISKHYQSEIIKYIYKEWFDFDFVLSDFSQTKLNLPTRKKITKEDNINIFGKGGNITGYHYNKVLIDDIVTEKDRYSKAERESTKNYVRELQNIKTVNGQIISTLTTWHPDDASTILPEAKMYPVGTIDIPGFTPDYLEKLKKTMTVSLYAANYLLKHIADEGRPFADIEFKSWDYNQLCYGWVDPAYSGKNTTALALIQLQDNDIVCRGYVWNEHIVELYDKIISLLKSFNCLEVFIENNKDEGLSAREIRKNFPMTRDIRSTDNKIYRISFYIKKVYDILYLDPDSDVNFIEQITYYEEGQEPDDAPDALASLIREMKLFETDRKESDVIGDVQETSQGFEW